MTKLQPCPRCRSPFVEAHDESRSIENPKTSFACSVCGLNVEVPVHRAEAVGMWNAWKRGDPTAEAAARTAESMAEELAKRPERLERLVIALLRSPATQGLGPSPLDAAAWVVARAREIERLMDLSPAVARALVQGLTFEQALSRALSEQEPNRANALPPQ